MDTIDKMLDAFEEALELERELGTRTVECDRALLLPPRASANLPPSAAVAAQVGRINTQPASRSTGQPIGAQYPTPNPQSSLRASAPPRESSAPAIPRPSSPTRSNVLNSSTPQPLGSPVADFVFIAVRKPEGEAADLLAKMVGAMGYTMSSVLVTTAAEAAQAKPSARVQIVLGSDAFRVFAPEQRAALGLWTTVFDVPTVVTYSPARILSYFRNDQDGLRKAKVQIWNDLKGALARIGKVPPKKG